MNSAARYFVPKASNYSLPLSLGVFTLALGFILSINGTALGKGVMLAGFALMLWMIFGWFAAVVQESTGGCYANKEDKSFRYGMVWFIFTELMFFGGFFGALFYLRVLAVPELAGYDRAFTPYPNFTAIWPSSGPNGHSFTPVAIWGIPAINTVILLTSGVTLTWAHFGLQAKKRWQLIAGLALTIALGAIFLGLQAYEYHHAYTELGLTLGAGVYGATFFMLTGFHGFHVLLGAIILAVMLWRVCLGHFSPQHHFAFEAASWYWHFVDVVWLLLFVLVYWL